MNFFTDFLVEVLELYRNFRPAISHSLLDFDYSLFQLKQQHPLSVIPRKQAVILVTVLELNILISSLFLWFLMQINEQFHFQFDCRHFLPDSLKILSLTACHFRILSSFRLFQKPSHCNVYRLDLLQKLVWTLYLWLSRTNREK